jgi:hypothetical protein
MRSAEQIAVIRAAQFLVWGSEETSYAVHRKILCNLHGTVPLQYKCHYGSAKTLNGVNPVSEVSRVCFIPAVS